MKKINFNVPFKGISGEALLDHKGEGLMINNEVANQIYYHFKTDKKLEAHSLALKLYNAKGEVEVTDTEKLLLRGVAEQCFNIGCAAQIIELVQ